MRRIDRATLVLGSTQPRDVVDAAAAGRKGVVVERRRSGGGAVLVAPGDTLWVDAWVPRGDPLWRDDVVHAAYWVGEWWAAALRAAGLGHVNVHRGPLRAAPGSELVCFAGRGPGEVFVDAYKVVGVAQWRGREGALFHTAAYRRWDPAALLDLLNLAPVERQRMTAALAGVARGVDELLSPATPSAVLAGTLLESLPQPASWLRPPERLSREQTP